jgi:predicted PurR-regulated permease PerM
MDRPGPAPTPQLASTTRVSRPSHRALRPATPASRRTLQIGFALGAVVLSLIVLDLMRDVLGAFVLGALIAFLIAPVVDRMATAGIPRSLSILAVFIVLVAVLAGLVTAVFPLLVSELESLRRQAPTLAGLAEERLSALQGQPLEILGFHVDLTGMTQSLSKNFNDFLLGQFGTALSFGITALTTAFQVVLMLIVAFLLALDSHKFSRTMRDIVPVDYRPDFDEIWSDVKAMLYAYMRGQLIIAALIGVACAIAVQALGLPYALALGLLAAITSLVPYLGPFLGAIPAVLVGLAISPESALLVAAAYLVISNVILNFVYPKVVGDAVRLPPVLVITAFLAGFSLGGILGMFIAIPIAATFRILYDHVQPRLYAEQEA